MSKNVGGYIRGPWWRYNGKDDENTRRCFVIAWGHVVQHPEEWYRDLRMIRFVIKTGRGAGRNEKHLVCVAYGESTAEVIMRAMEKGDIVLVCGTWVEKPYNTKKGPKVGYECRVNFIVPQELIGFLLDLYGTPQITKIVADRQNEDADVWEGD